VADVVEVVEAVVAAATHEDEAGPVMITN